MRRSSLSREQSGSSSRRSLARWITGRHASPFGAHVAVLSAIFVILTVEMAPLAEESALLAMLLVLCLVLVQERRSLSLTWLLFGCAALSLWAILRPEVAPLLVVFVYVFAWNGAPLLAPLPGVLGIVLRGAHTFVLPVCALLLGAALYFWRRESKELLEQADALRQRLYRAEQTELTLLADHRDVQRLAQLEERRTLAEKLHDNLGHELTAAHLSAKSVRVLLERDDIERALASQQKSEGRIAEALRQLAAAVSRLDPGEEAGVRPLAELFERFVYPVDLSIEGDSLGIEPYQIQLLYSAVKEALTNVAKHAAPRSVVARIEFAGHLVRVTVTNDGVAGDITNRSGRGLRYLRKRLEAVRGSLSTNIDKGRFTLIVTLPMRNA